jgi:hypothetical protein
VTWMGGERHWRRHPASSERAPNPRPLHPNPPPSFRGQRAYDGSWGGSGQGFIPCPPGLKYCVRVSTLPPGLDLGRIMAQDVLFGGPGSKKGVAGTVASTLRGAQTLGRLGATLGGYAGGDGKALLPEDAARLTMMMRTLSGWRTPGEGEADIWPGRRHALPMGRTDWILTMMSPAVSQGAGLGVGWETSRFGLGGEGRGLVTSRAGAWHGPRCRARANRPPARLPKPARALTLPPPRSHLCRSPR